MHGWARFVSIGLALWLAAFAAHAQDTLRTVTIQVVDRAGGKPISGVAAHFFVPTAKTTWQATSDRNGRIVFPGQRPFVGSDTVFVELTHPGYASVSAPLFQLLQTGGVVELTVQDWLLDEVVVSGNRQREPKVRVAQPIRVIDAAEITAGNPPTSAEVLQQAGVFVQRSQLGGGSPVLRGFEASRVLIVVDGVRLNNTIYRTGHLQNVITLDPAMLERVEVLYGAGSTLYGSDALGGVMHFVTREPSIGSTFGGSFVRYGSAANELAGNAWVNVGGRKLASLTSLSYKQFDDLRIGQWRRSVWPAGFGQKPFRVARIDGTDTVLPADPNRLTPVGYDQVDLLQKLRYEATEGLRLTLNLQGSTSSDIPRYDAQVELTPSGLPEFARWDYGPQHRVFAALTTELLTGTAWFDYARITPAYQYIEESRIDRRFGNPSERTQQERVQVASLNADFTKELGVHTLRYGAEVVQNWVASDAWRINIDTGVRTERPDQTRYPAGGAEQFTAAMYVSERWELRPGLWLSAGGRYSWTRVENRFRDGAFVPLPGFFDQTENTVGALTGMLGMVFVPSPRWRFAAQASSGFRAPNVNDLGKFFDSRPGDGGDGLVVPNPTIGAERTWNVEGTVQYTPSGKLLVSATAFYTWIDDLISLGLAQFNGQDSVDAGGTRYRVYSYQNLTRARILGASAEVRYLPSDHWEVSGQGIYTNGVVQAPVGSPLSHIPPAYGQLGLHYKRSNWNARLQYTVHAWKYLDEYQLNAEDNEASATPLGTPNWWTIDIRAEATLWRELRLQLALENVFDQHYRPFASDISAPGRNLVVALRYQWE